MTISPLTALRVSFCWSEADRMPVGRLVLFQRRILFEYAPSFLLTGLQPSPLSLRAVPGVLEQKKGVFDGLPGLCNDSLPDGWGRLLLDRHVAGLGLDPSQLTPLDRLAGVGHRGIGALVYEPEFPLGERRIPIHLDLLSAQSARILAGSAAELLPELVRLGGSPAGARPKVLLAWRQADDQLVQGTEKIPAGYTPLLVKFAAKDDPRDIGAIEYAYAEMAQAAGVQMMPSFLFPAKRGPGYFATERFDRPGTRRIHVHSVSGLLQVDHRAAALDYEAILRVALVLTRDQRQVLKLYRLMVFNVLAHNQDDHAKQFSFLMEPGGTWMVAPAYDLTFSEGPGGEHMTTVAGRGRDISEGDLEHVAKRVGIPVQKARAIHEEVSTAIGDWNEIAEATGVSRTMRLRLAKRLGALR